MEATLTRSPGRALGISGALLAVGFIVAMLVFGRPPESTWRVQSEVGGLLREPPARIQRVLITTDGRRLDFARMASGTWVDSGRASPVPEAIAFHLERSLRAMHASPPVRILTRDEWTDGALREFGLEPPSYAVTLAPDGAAPLEAAFGVPNPQKVLQYMRVTGHDTVYLMSRFVGQEWEHVINAATPP